MTVNKKIIQRKARANRSHAMVKNVKYPRLLVYKSNRTLYGQIIDDNNHKIICGFSGLKIKETGIDAAKQIGKKIAEMAKEKKISQISFDRNGYKYHGQIKALADSARENGLKF